MPKTKLQNIIFTILMAGVMVYAMICYNISLNIGGMKNEVFLMALGELKIMLPVAFVLEFFLVDKLAHKMAFSFVKPTDRPIVIATSISMMIVLVMCPLMSLVATMLFKNPGSQIVAIWLETTFMNFPMAFFFQVFFAGPVVRNIFNGLVALVQNPAREAVNS